jgi:hypothetical protein
MATEGIIQGRCVTSQDLTQVRTWLSQHPSWHRTRLSRELCVLWGWRNEAGQLKDMACRTLLLKLQARGLIQLPARQRAPVNGSRNRHSLDIPHDTTALEISLSSLRPLRVELVASGSSQSRLFQFLLHRYHYLSHHNSVGENLRYLIYDSQDRPLACLLFGSAAWKCRPRDLFIGWNPSQRQQRLHWLTNNTRFLILPWIKVAHLASHTLRLITRRLSRDWQAKYAHPIHLLETFVESDRFRGTCYRAAGWISVGHTTGRGRNSPTQAPQGPTKEVLLQPLHPEFRRRLLCA